VGSGWQKSQQDGWFRRSGSGGLIAVVDFWGWVRE